IDLLSPRPPFGEPLTHLHTRVVGGYRKPAAQIIDRPVVDHLAGHQEHVLHGVRHEFVVVSIVPTPQALADVPTHQALMLLDERSQLLLPLHLQARVDQELLTREEGLQLLSPLHTVRRISVVIHRGVSRPECRMRVQLLLDVTPTASYAIYST